MAKTSIFMFILFTGVLTKAKGQNTFPSTGNVGIGTVSPGYLLDVNNGDINISPSHSYRVNGQYGLFWDGNQNGIGLGTKNDFPVNVYANSAVSRLTVNANGKIGIGTTTPANLLTINTGVTRDGINLISNVSTGGLEDIRFNISSTSAIAAGLANQWLISLRNDGYFSNSPSNTGLSLEFYAIRQGGGYYAPLEFTSTGNLVLVSNKQATSGNVLIGKTAQTNTSYKLDVNGNIRADKVVVNTSGADYVFEPTYHLMPLDSLDSFVRKYHHLPGISTAAEMARDGSDLSNLYTKLLEKMEDMTRYIIEQSKLVEQQGREIDSLNPNSDYLPRRSDYEKNK